MKTAELINSLAADPPAPPIHLGRRVTLALALGAAASLAVFMAALGPRPDIAEAARSVRFDLKFVDTLTLLAPSALLCWRLMRPDARPGALALLLVAPFALLAGAVVAELALPIAGLMSLMSFEDVHKALIPLRAAAKGLGVVLAEPFLQVAFLPLPVIPHLKITDMGLVDVDRFEFVRD